MVTQAPPRYMQGIAVPATSVRQDEFYQRTRRRITTEASRTYAGLGGQDVIELKKSDIIAGIYVRFDGSVTSTPGTGTVATTARWPYDIIKAVRFTANGQSNLINCSGLKLKMREFQALGDLTDRGVSQSVNGATVTQGTLSQGSEAWGVGNRATAIAAGTYDMDLTWYVPVAEDQRDLAGAIFAATSSTDLTLTIDWASAGDLFALTGNGAASLAGTLTVTVVRFSVPLGADGEIVVPDLSTFHSLIQTRHTAISNGENEVRLVGQGAGKTLLRLSTQLWNGAGVGAPVVLNEDNFGRCGWRYGSNETPDEFFDGQTLRMINERNYNVDMGAIWGIKTHEFAVENAFRDTVDLGTTSEFRVVETIQSSVVLTNPALEIVSESIFSAGAGG